MSSDGEVLKTAMSFPDVQVCHASYLSQTGGLEGILRIMSHPAMLPRPT